MECYLELYINIPILRRFNILIVHEKNKMNKIKLEKKEKEIKIVFIDMSVLSFWKKPKEQI